MLDRRTLLGAVLAVGTALSAPASASDCVPARVSVEAAALPHPWRRALEALAAATRHEGQPWSCPDARLTLIPPTVHGLAQLQVEDASGVRRRPVASPAEVVPLGEAMLARAFTLDAPSNLPVPPPPPGPLELHLVETPDDPLLPAPALPQLRRGPEMLVDLLVGSHFTGPTKAMLLGPELRATMMFDRWSAGLVARYDTAIAYLQPVPDQFSLSSVTVGLAGGYRLLAAPVELMAAVEPTLAVVLMGDQRPGEVEPDIDARVDMRLGARLSAALPVTGRLRAVCALGGEGAPAALFGDRASRRHELPTLPGYLVGLSLGVELQAIR